MTATLPIVRRPKFGLDELPKHWANGNPIITHFINAMHLAFPDGEKMFIRSVQAFRDSVSDPELRDRVKAFIGQEVQHGVSHEKFWDTMRAHGLPVDAILDYYQKSAYDRVEGAAVRFIGKTAPLTATAGLEHWTAMLAEAVLRTDMTRDLPEEMQELLNWHAAEEIEHKSVAFDVMQAAGVPYLRRMMGFLGASVAFNYYIAVMFVWLLATDKDIDWIKAPGHTLELLQRLLPGMAIVVPQFLAYLMPGFHPDKIDNNDLLAKVITPESRYVS